MIPRVALASLFAAAATMGCAAKRGPTPPLCESFDNDLAPPLSESCGGCHSGDSPAGGYAVGTYLDVIGEGSDDVPNAIAGDGDSRLLAVLDPETADANHQGFDELRQRLETWIVSCELRYSANPIHAAGILNPASDGFHGELLRQAAYDFDECRRCHGDDLSGGLAEASCTSCHAEGPTTCGTCHDATLRNSGAHGAHVGLVDGALDFAACDSCHATPSQVGDVGHVRLEDGSIDDAPAELIFGALAALDPESGGRMGPPTYDASTNTCAQVYCHGDTTADSAAALTQPSWFGSDQATCGTCHGVPPADHASDACETCHQRVAGADLTFVAPELHVDGVVQIGRHGPACTSCHGTEGGLASPPLDLAGGTSTDRVTVGAHRAHVMAPSQISAPIPCADCHMEPSAIDDAGHIDTALPAEVFPGGAAFGGLAASDGAVPSWDRETGTCSDVYCHGGGTRLGPEGDTSPGVIRVVDFTEVGVSAVYCGTCHGIPPSGSPHTPDMVPTDCQGCHADTVDEYGGIIVSGPPGARTSTHIDGRVN